MGKDREGGFVVILGQSKHDSKNYWPGGVSILSEVEGSFTDVPHSSALVCVRNSEIAPVRVSLGTFLVDVGGDTHQGNRSDSDSCLNFQGFGVVKKKRGMSIGTFRW